MSTIRQEKLAHALINNSQASEPLNKQELVASVGYSDLSAEHKATEIIESVGVQNVLRKLGFDSNNAKRVVAEIMNKEDAQDKDRLKAADMIFEVFGDKAPEKHLVVTRRIISVDE